MELAFVQRPGTLLVIAHRISSALRARRILVLDGAGVALGTHDKLIATSPLYRDLVGRWSGEAGDLDGLWAANGTPTVLDVLTHTAKAAPAHVARAVRHRVTLRGGRG